MTADSATKKPARESSLRNTSVEEDDEGIRPAPTADDGIDLDLSSDIKGIIAALQHVREKAQKDGQKKNEEVINSVAAEIKFLIDETKEKSQKERQYFIKAVTKICKEREAAMKNEFAKYQSAFESFCKEKNAHVQAYEDIFLKFEDEKEKLLARLEQQRKKDKAAINDLQKLCGDKISAAEESLKKKKLEEKSFTILRKSLGSFLESNSDDDLDE